jgi:hypothetical protein
VVEKGGKEEVGGRRWRRRREGGNCWYCDVKYKLETEGKHKTNGEINEKTKHKRQRELNKPYRMSQHFDDSSIYF